MFLDPSAGEQSQWNASPDAQLSDVDSCIGIGIDYDWKSISAMQRPRIHPVTEFGSDDSLSSNARGKQ